MSSAAFLFGSGISRASGGPSVDYITDLLLNQLVHTDIVCTQSFLKLVKAEINDHLRDREGRDANYEDLYAATYQIFQDLTGDITSPLARHSTEILRKESLELQRQLPRGGWEDPFVNLLASADDLIQSIVWRELQPVTEPKKLSVVAEVAASTEALDIFTLNHDLLIENLFSQRRIPFSDGFGDEDGSLARFSWSWKSEDRVRLFKLHGSINWFRYDFERDDGRKYRQYARVEGDHRHCKLANGRFAREVDQLPAVLTGTTVKEQTYGIYLFGDIFSRFREYLSQHDTVIASGYGWGDKGINHRLYQWLGDGDDHRIIILHNNPDEKVENKKFWGYRWDECRRAGKVQVVEKWLGECTLAHLTPFFDQS
jgi:hypothetical protein